MAKVKTVSDDYLYKVYTADIFKGICKSLGNDVSMRYYDMIENKGVEETRTAEEIITGIRAKLGGTNESDI